VAIREQMSYLDKPRSGLALGGIGTGSLELRRDGIFRNWTIFGNTPLGQAPAVPFIDDSMLFFLVRYQVQGQNPKLKILQIDEGYKIGNVLCQQYAHPWLSGIGRTEYEGDFPFIRMKFTDDEMPLEVTMEAWSPFVPHDVKNSSLPTAIFNLSVKSLTRKPVDVMILASMRNAVGYDCPDRVYKARIVEEKGIKLVEHSAGKLPARHATAGSMAIASLSDKSTYYAGWDHFHPYYERLIRSRVLPNDDFTKDRSWRQGGSRKITAGPGCFASIAVSKKLTAKSPTLDNTFVAAWHFPNLYSKSGTHIEGRYYANAFRSAAAVVGYVAKNAKGLRTATQRFHDAFFDSSLPEFVNEQIASNLNTFRTSTWLTKAGDFGCQEGTLPDRAMGPLATIDVAMYGSISTAALFPSLDRSALLAHMRLQSDIGAINHGIGHDFTTGDKQESVTGRLDLPSQYVVMAMRNFFWTGDRDYLEEIWPSIKAAINYVVEHRDQNGDGMPDMGGAMCTYDNFPMFGVASYVCSCWLSALGAAAVGAELLGDAAAQDTFTRLLDNGRTTFEDLLWTGDYYRLYNDKGGPKGDIDDGCLTDQIIGEWANHLSGVAPMLKNRAHVRKALRTIMTQCYSQEVGLSNCSWPEDGWLHDIPEDVWADQANTVWTGVELAFASFLIYEGMWKQGLEVIRNVDDRYRRLGLYWDHLEWGGHYYRPQSAWAILNASLGLAINNGAYTFAPKMPGDDLKLFFAHGKGTAHYVRKLLKTGERISIEAATGAFSCSRLTLALKTKDATRVVIKARGKVLSERAYSAIIESGSLTVEFKRGLTVREGDSVSLTVH
jgi:uncharacterized protein (DUF608 family)